MPQTKLVLFDVGNVIVRATHKITEAILWELGVRPDKVALFFHSPAYGEFARGKITGEQFAQAVREALEAPWLTDDQIRAAHDAHIYTIDEAVREVLEQLDAQQIPLGLVTTTNVWQTERERQLINLADAFGPVVRSHEIGMTKTDPGAWSVILTALNWQGRAPSTILLVDDARANCEAAKYAGLQTHLYDPTPVTGVVKLHKALQSHGLLS